MQIDQKNHPDEREARALVEIARGFRSSGYDRPIGATHCLSMAAWEDQNLINHVLTEMKSLGISMVVCPRATLNNKQDREVTSRTHNSIAPWFWAMKAGVNVALGTDNVSDIYMPYSDGDIWKEVDVLLNTVRYDGDMPNIADILTVNGRKALGI
jgi:cytosine/adenosine deaminase-related metal-dependent hydrolase